MAWWVLQVIDCSRKGGIARGVKEFDQSATGDLVGRHGAICGFASHALLPSLSISQSHTTIFVFSPSRLFVLLPTRVCSKGIAKDYCPSKLCQFQPPF